MRGTLVLLLAMLAAPAAAVTPEEEVQYYVEIFKNPYAQVDVAIDELGWKGISDARVFDLIEDRLLRDAAEASRRSRMDRNRVNRSIKALGYSGQAQYEPTLSDFLRDRAYAGYATRALANLKLYAAWNPVISDRTAWDPRLPDDDNRVRNMLNSKDVRLQGIGAKRVFFAHFEQPVLVDLVAQRLRECYKTVSDPESVDAAGWMVNALGKAPAGEKYRDLLAEVANNAQQLSLSQRAEKAMRR